MRLLYTHEHTACINYERRTPALIEVLSLSAGRHLKLTSRVDKLIFLPRGSLRFSFGEYTDRHINAGKALLLPAGYMATGTVLTDSRVIIIRMDKPQPLCDCFSLEKLLDSSCGNESRSLNYLDINAVLHDYLDQLGCCITHGLRCTRFLRLKLEELFFIFRAFYTKEDLLDFFALYLTSDMAFSKSVFKHHLQARNARELATLLNYSYSGFIKRFNRVFHLPPYRWMKQQKAHRIFHEINATDKSLQEISLEYGFSSQGRFSDFCREAFGLSPKEIRLNRKKGKNPEKIYKYV